MNQHTIYDSKVFDCSHMWCVVWCYATKALPSNSEWLTTVWVDDDSVTSIHMKQSAAKYTIIVHHTSNTIPTNAIWSNAVSEKYICYSSAHIILCGGYYIGFTSAHICLYVLSLWLPLVGKLNVGNASNPIPSVSKIFESEDFLVTNSLFV